MRKNKKKKIIVLLLLVFFILHIKSNTNIFSNINNIIYKVTANSDYEIIKQDKNKKYLGIGQEKIENKDGYFTTFSTIETNKKIYKEYKQNSDSSWRNNKYWGGTMSENGCGITSISIILSGYNKDYTPEDLRKKYAPVLNAEKISDELSNTFGIENSDFYYDSIHLSEKKLEEHLKTNRPILVCVWNNPSENRWTKSSHYMVLLATDGNKMVYVSNPNRS